jgi:hypothetical protein
VHPARDGVILPGVSAAGPGMTSCAVDLVDVLRTRQPLLGVCPDAVAVRAFRRS